MAVPEDDMSVVVVVSSMNIEALTSEISDVSSASSVEVGSDVVSVHPWSHGGSNSDSPAVASLVGKGSLSVSSGSDGVGSLIEDKPLSVVPWSVVSDSESVLVSTNMLVPEEGLVAGHS